MNESKYRKYLIDKPIREVGAKLADIIKGHTTPTLTYVSDKLITGCNTYVEFGWIWEMPQPNPHIHEHIHNYDEIIMHIGFDYSKPEDLGAEIEFVVDGDPLIINRTSALFIPKGVRHGPVTWKRVDKPHIQMAIFSDVGDMLKIGVGGYPI